MVRQWVVVRLYSGQIVAPFGQWTCPSYENATELALKLAMQHDARMGIFEMVATAVPGIAPPTPPPTTVRLT